MLFVFNKFKKRFLKKILAKEFLLTSTNILLIVVLLFVWFGSKSTLAAGEEGIPFYNVVKTLHIYASYFYNTGLGESGIFNVPRVPLFVVLSLFQHLGFTGWQIQAGLYFILLLIPIISLPYLIKLFYKPYTAEIGFIASVFYLFNLYVLSQVLTRFVLSLFILWSILPLFVILFIQFVISGKVKYLLAFSLINILFADVYLIISPIITLWLCAFLSLPLVILQGVSKRVIFLRVFSVFFIWIVLSSWWIIPFWVLRNESSAAAVNPGANIVSLREVSKYFPSQDLLLLKQAFLFGKNGRIFYPFYEKLLVQGIAVTGLVITLLGIFYTILPSWLEKKELKSRVKVKQNYLFYKLNKLFKNGFYFFILFISGWFISKGANPPLGDWFYSFIFKYIPILQIFRNPYEKFGIVFLLAYSFFFAVGLFSLSNLLKKLKYVILVCVLIIICGYLVKPIWTGGLFANYNKINVPSYYQDADTFILSEKKEDQRILQLPLLHYPAIAYTWGYLGEEPSEFLFTNASLSRLSSNNHADWLYDQLDRSDIVSNSPYFVNYLQFLHVGYIVIHHDEIQSSYFRMTPDNTKSYVDVLQGIKFEKTFGSLDIYSVSNPGEIIYISNSVKKYKDESDLLSQVLSENFVPNQEVFVEDTNRFLKEAENSSNKPSYKLIKNSTVHYSLSINNAQSPYIVVLSNNYNSAWKAVIGKNIVPNHIVVNGFANGWLIDKKGTYTIDIVFSVWPWTYPLR